MVHRMHTEPADRTPQLPAGLTSRPLELADAQGIVDVMAAEQLADLGEVLIELADIEGDWSKPSYDLASSSVGVFDGERLVGYAEVGTQGWHGDAAVHPDYHGRGIGTWLAHAMQGLARRKGSAIVGMPVPAGSTADRLLEGLGYHVRWQSWILELPAGSPIPDRPLPPGYALTSATPEQHPQVWQVIEDAFLEWSVRDREPYDDWAAGVIQRPGFQPWNLRVILNPAGEVVAAAFVMLTMDDTEMYVDKLATRRDQRNRGLAQALLADAYALTLQHQARKLSLSTDSRTGALGLYEKVGMVVTSDFVHRAIALD